MQSMPSTGTSFTFKLDSKRAPQIAAAIEEYLRGDIEKKEGQQRESEEEKRRLQPDVTMKN